MIDKLLQVLIEISHYHDTPQFYAHSLPDDASIDNTDCNNGMMRVALMGLTVVSSALLYRYFNSTP